MSCCKRKLNQWCCKWRTLVAERRDAGQAAVCSCAVLLPCQVQKQSGRVLVTSTTLAAAIPAVTQKGYLLSQESFNDILWKDHCPWTQSPTTERNQKMLILNLNIQLRDRFCVHSVTD